MNASRNDVSIVVAPRERLTSVVESLRSLFATIPDNIPVVVVEGGTPDKVRRQLAELQKQRPFQHLRFDHLLIPNVARNRGALETSTPYLVFADNDIHYQPGWLEALLANADREGADAVAPLICIGPPVATTVHHAGGSLVFEHQDGVPTLLEKHRLMNTPLRDAAPDSLPVRHDVCEFHCCMMRRSLFDRIGGLDERLITREQMDFALRCKSAGAKVTFAADSVVTYMAFTPFDPVDLPYHMFRWSDALTVRSLDAFENSWSTTLDRTRIRHRWIARHRSRAAATVHGIRRRLMGKALFDRLVTHRYEAAVASEVAHALNEPEPLPSPSLLKPALELVTPVQTVPAR